MIDEVNNATDARETEVRETPPSPERAPRVNWKTLYHQRDTDLHQMLEAVAQALGVSMDAATSITSAELVSMLVTHWRGVGYNAACHEYDAEISRCLGAEFAAHLPAYIQNFARKMYERGRDDVIAAAWEVRWIDDSKRAYLLGTVRWEEN